MATHPFHLEGTITDRLSQTPVPVVLVEAWDREEKHPEVLASALTDKAGKFTLSFDHGLVAKAFGGRPPIISLKVFYKGTRVAYAPSDQEITLGSSSKPLALTIKVPQSYGGNNIFQHLPADIRAELEALKAHGDALLSKLKDEKSRQAFLENPGQVLAEMGIPLSAQLRQRLSTQPPPRNMATPRAFRLLNGQIITPRITINFTSGKKEDIHGR